MKNAKKITESYDVVVLGGGLAGVAAAVSAARHGAKTCLVQDRPVFGGNSSSEVRVTPHGAAAFHAYARETGIISELLIEERARNHEPIVENGWTNSVWDLTLYDMVVRTPNLKFHLNTSVTGLVMKSPRQIESVVCTVAHAETEITISAKLFVDCTGDGVVAAEAGCEWRMGSEAREEFGEPHAPRHASADVMGSSIHFKTRDVGYPTEFVPPEWAVHYDDPDFFYRQGRIPKEVKSGYWWLEIGVPWNTIYQSEDIRHELTRHTLGVWDWIKNRDPLTIERTRNLSLDWIGQVPGKRESRRVLGLYMTTENDVQNRTTFPDEIAFGGWFIDVHTPGGLLAKTSEPASAEQYEESSEYAAKSYAGPFGIPLRILIAKDVDNLMMAGRNVSATHAALSTIRVMETTALLGQAAGTAAAVSLSTGVPIHNVPEIHAAKVQQMLLRDGCFLPSARNQDEEDLARKASVTASSQALLFGVGPDSQGWHQGLDIWRDQAREVKESLDARRGQWIAVGSNSIEGISVCLSNDCERIEKIGAVLSYVENIWDYTAEPQEQIASAELLVPPGKKQWVSWAVGLRDLEKGRYVRVDLLRNPNVRWHVAGRIEPGHVAAFDMGHGRMRRFASGLTMSFRVKPPQPCYEPCNVLSGVTRPYDFTNLWRSDPAQPLPQWIEFEWAEPQSITQVELTFPGHLLREYHAYAPFYRDPQCPRDYRILAHDGGKWRELLNVEGNYQRHRRHKLPTPAQTNRLRVSIDATNGDPSAAIYEVRCYA